MEFINKELEKCHNEYVKLLKLWDDAYEKLEAQANIFNRRKLEKEYDNAGNNFTDYSENVYAKVIYDTYSKIKPALIRVRTGQKCTWDEVFKDSFDKLNKLDRGILVGLVEESGGYRFA